MTTDEISVEPSFTQAGAPVWSVKVDGWGAISFVSKEIADEAVTFLTDAIERDSRVEAVMTDQHREARRQINRDIRASLARDRARLGQ